MRKFRSLWPPRQVMPSRDVFCFSQICSPKRNFCDNRVAVCFRPLPQRAVNLPLKRFLGCLLFFSESPGSVNRTVFLKQKFCDARVAYLDSFSQCGFTRAVLKIAVQSTRCPGGSSPISYEADRAEARDTV